METATKWLFDKLWDTPKDKLTWYAILQEAEKMHENQIKDAFYDGKNLYNNWEDGSNQYYNETYGGNK